MKIIGKLLKKSTEIGYKRINRKNIDHQNQLTVLNSLLEKAKQTEFGFFHDFSSFLSIEDTVEQFQSVVPISDYEEFYAKWLHKTISGQKDCTWRGKVKYYALSSGTTGSPSKRIPVSTEMIRSFQKTSVRQLSILHELDLSDAFFNASILAVGGSTKLTKIERHIEGDLSGILKKHTSLIVKPLAKPGAKIAALKDWNEKINAIVEKAPLWNISIIAGIPSWCIMLMERIIERYKLDNIHQMWPNLEVYVHGGVFIEPYKKRLEKISAKPIFLLDTYLASEGYFAYQISPSKKGMRLLVENQIFFEFIPFTSDFFDENGELISKYKALTISEVKEGVDYALVISTNAGLWRYLIGDLVRFININEREIIITGRIKQFLSLCGEHLSLDNINSALTKLNKREFPIEPEFTIFANIESQSHHWYFETKKDNLNPESLIQKIDSLLSKINDDYYSARKYTLQAPKAILLPEGTMYKFMQSSGKIGGQNKMPRVLNEKQAKQWKAFLEENGL